MSVDLTIFNFSDLGPCLSEADAPHQTEIAVALNLSKCSVRRLIGQADSMALYKITIPHERDGASFLMLNANVTGGYGAKEEFDAIVSSLQEQLVGTRYATTSYDQIAQAFLCWLGTKS